ncbi:cell wall-active antibiotics response protein [bacterium]|nr:MAG: cell wall-active antibiotics response protein [bacterium]
MDNQTFRFSPQLMIGAAIMILGFLFLFDNLNVIDAGRIIRLWPVLFILFGILKISQSRNPSSWFVGGVFIFIGSIMTLGRLGIMHFSLHQWWPIFLIIVGISFLLKAWTRHQHGAVLGASRIMNHDESTVNVVTFMGGNHIKNISQDFRGGEVTAVMGGVEMDLRQASMSGEAILNVFTFWGGIDIKVPPDWNVIMNGIPILGGIDDKTVQPADSQSKRFVIKGYAIMGGVEIKN